MEISKFILDKIINQYLSNFGEAAEGLEFNFKRTDKSGRDIYYCQLPSERFGFFKLAFQSACIIMKIKTYFDEKDNGKKKLNIDFSYEFFSQNGVRVGYSSHFYIYDFNNDKIKFYNS